MPTLAGPWIGSGTVKGRLLCGYVRTYSADHTTATFAGTLYIEFNYSTYDSTNSWAVSGDDGSHSGSNLNVNLSSGGQVAFYTFSFTKAGDGVIGASVSGINAVNATVSESFTMDVGVLAPFMVNSNYAAQLITANGFGITGINASGNGNVINGTQLEWNTAAAESGSTLVTASGYVNIQGITGLKRATLHYFRVRVKTLAYGYGAWGAWKSFTTLSTVPGVPNTTWTIDSIDQTSAAIGANTVADNGGLPLTGWDVQYNTSETDVGSVTITTADPVLAGPLTLLIPGTTYSVRLRAKNANGYGAYSAWKTFITLPGVYVLVGGVWKNAVPYVNVASVWKPAVRYVKVNGIWQQ